MDMHCRTGHLRYILNAFRYEDFSRHCNDFQLKWWMTQLGTSFKSFVANNTCSTGRAGRFYFLRVVEASIPDSFLLAKGVVVIVVG